MIAFNFQAVADSPFVHFLGWFLVHSLWQTIIIGPFTAVVLIGLSRASANLRYLIALFALGLMIALPLLTSKLLAPKSMDNSLSTDIAKPNPIMSFANDALTLPQSQAHTNGEPVVRTNATRTTSPWDALW